MRRLATATLLIVVAFQPASPVAAQSTPPDPQSPTYTWPELIGSQVRIVAPEGQLLGRVQASLGDSVWIVPDGDGEAIPIEIGAGLRVDRWQRGPLNQSIITGSALLGGVLGGFVGARLNNLPARRECVDEPDNWITHCDLGGDAVADITTTVERRRDEVIAVFIGATIGAGVGSFVGWLGAKSAAEEGWLPINVPVADVAPTRGPRGTAITLQLSLGR